MKKENGEEEEDSERVRKIKRDIAYLKKGFIIYNSKSWWSGKRYQIIIRMILKVLRDNYEAWELDEGNWIGSKRVYSRVYVQYNKYIDDIIRKINEGKISFEELDSDIRRDLRRVRRMQKRRKPELKKGRKNVNEPESIENYRLSMEVRKEWVGKNMVKNVLLRMFPKFINYRNPRVGSVRTDEKGKVHWVRIADMISLTNLGKMAIGKMPIQDLRKAKGGGGENEEE